METIEFIPLDVSYEVVGREPVIVLWGITTNGDRVVLFDKRFRPYFYVLPDSDDQSLLNKLSTRIKSLSKARSPIISIDIVEKKYYGIPRRALKVTTVVPEYVREYREEVRKIDGVKEVLEADIRFAMRYLIDKEVYPFDVYRATVEEISRDNRFRVDKVYELAKDMEKVGTVGPDILSQLRIMAFDIEVYNQHGTPSPERDPVIIISVASNTGEEKTFLAEDHNDARIIREFVEYIRYTDPDIIVGYNNNNFDWPYLLERSKRIGIKLDVSRRAGTEPATSVHGHISIAGRLNVDLYDYAEEIPEIKVKTLEEVAEYLGVMKKSDRTHVNWWDIPKYWDDKTKRGILVKYALDDVKATIGLADKIIPFAIQLSNVTGLPLDQVGAMSVGFRLEWYLMRVAFKMNELVPNRIERKEESYRGAIVLKPLRGLHEDIAVLDFSSMYPNIMIKYNVGPDTLRKNGLEIGLCNIAPEVGHCFRKEPPGFFKSVLSTLLRLRKEVRNTMKRFPANSPEYRILDERQRALKLLANASYGYMGWVAARWYCRECAEAVTAWGRNLILSSIDYAKKLGLKVIYGDTDSLFVEYKEDLVRKLIDYVENKLGFEIKIDKIYRRVFFTEAKKRYVGLLADGRIDIVGFEAVRGDWCELAKEVQEKVAETILKTGSIDEAVNYVKKVVEELSKGRIPLEKLIIWKTLSKKLSDYDQEAPHVVAARRMEQAGYKVSPGMKIGYVVVKGRGKIAPRSYPYFMVSVDKVDIDYYVDHQIVPSAMRILGYFGVSEKRVKTTMRGQKSLFDYLART